MSVARSRNARASMTMRAVVQANATTAKDDYGQPAAPSWSTSQTIPCFAYSERVGEVQGADKDVMVDVIRCHVPRGTAIADENRILNITDRLSVEKFDGPLQIRGMTVKETHLELTLRRIDSGPNLDL